VRLAPALAAGLVLAVASACGGSNGDDTASGRAIEPEAQQRAESINLTLADFPNGWRASAPEANNSGQNKFNKCIGADYSGLTKIGEAGSKDFATGDSTEASSQVVIFKDEQQAKNAMSKLSEAMGGAAAEDCFHDLIDEAMKKEGSNGFKVGDVDAGELSFTAPDVEEAKAWQIVVPVEITSGVGEGLSPNAYIELMMLRDDGTTAALKTSDVLTEFDRELRDRLAQTLANRMTDTTH
jgi:hypothetical protein